ncbi:hypothetical protein [Caulobacter phage Kronos]|uniref:Uncharacterized protein n=1 Tax=Caulobacter phage Kronos TaxID=2340873 RepID=A0A386KRS8_9CAUD|nr:hypothetical protein [Caulobacter phage Kronos]
MSAGFEDGGLFVSTKAAEAAIKAECPSPMSKLILACIAPSVDQHLQCFLRIETIMKRTGIKSEATVRAHLALLVKEGLLRIDQDHNAWSGRQLCNCYTLLLDVDGAKARKQGVKPRRPPTAASRRPAGAPRKAVSRSVDKPGVPVSSPLKNCGATPQNLRGTYPSKSDPLEPPFSFNQRETTGDGKGFCPERGKPSPQNEVEAKEQARAFVKGKRYALPGAPVIREPPAETQQQMAARLRASVK